MELGYFGDLTKKQIKIFYAACGDWKGAKYLAAVADVFQTCNIHMMFKRMKKVVNYEKRSKRSRGFKIFEYRCEEDSIRRVEGYIRLYGDIKADFCPAPWLTDDRLVKAEIIEEITTDTTAVLTGKQKILYEFLCTGFRSVVQMSEHMDCSKSHIYDKMGALRRYFPIERSLNWDQEEKALYWIDPTSFKSKYYKKTNDNGGHVWLDKCELCGGKEWPQAGDGMCLKCRQSHKYIKRDPIFPGKKREPRSKPIVNEDDSFGWSKTFNKQITKAFSKIEREGMEVRDAALNGNMEAMIRLKLKRTNGHSVELPKESLSPRKRLAEMGLRVYG